MSGARFVISAWFLRRRLLGRVCRGESVRHTFLAFSLHRLRWCWWRQHSEAKGLFATWLEEVDGSWEWKEIMKDTTHELFFLSRPFCWGHVDVIMLKLNRKLNVCFRSGVWFQYLFWPFLGGLWYRGAETHKLELSDDRPGYRQQCGNSLSLSSAITSASHMHTRRAAKAPLFLRHTKHVI